MTYLPLLPPPGIVKDDSSFAAEGRWADGDGFRFEQGRPVTIGGAVFMSSATTVGAVTKMLIFDNGGTVNLAVAGDTLRIGAVDAAGTDITPASGWTTGNVRRSLHMFGNILLASCAGGTLFESSGAQATAIGNAPDEISCFLVTASRQVMALGCNEEDSTTFNGRCIRWSDIETTDTWATTSTNNAGEYVLPGQADIVGGTLLGDYILIWTEAALWVARFVGDPAATFSFERVADVGIVAQDVFAVLRQTVYWMGPDKGFYAYTVGGLVERIACPVSSDLAAGSQTVFGSKWHACPNSRDGEIWFSASDVSNAATKYLVYCVDESLRAQRPVWFCGRYTTAVANMTSSAMIDSHLAWDDGTYKTAMILHSGATSKPYRWDCRSSSTVFNFGISGAYIQSADMYLDNSERRAMVRSFIADFEEQAGAVSLTLFMRDRPLEEAVTKGPYTIATSTALATMLTNELISSGGDEIDVDTNPEAMAAGVTFRVSGVNAYSGGDTGQLAMFTVTEDFIGGDGIVRFTPAMVNSGAGRNVVNLPANGVPLSALTRKGKKDLRASGKIMAARIATLGPFRVRFGKPLFDIIPLGER